MTAYCPLVIVGPASGCPIVPLTEYCPFVLVPPPPSIVDQLMAYWAWAQKQSVESSKQKHSRQILDCGGKRSATPLCSGSVPKRRRRSALPAHSKTLCVIHPPSSCFHFKPPFIRSFKEDCFIAPPSQKALRVPSWLRMRHWPLLRYWSSTAASLSPERYPAVPGAVSGAGV